MYICHVHPALSAFVLKEVDELITTMFMYGWKKPTNFPRSVLFANEAHNIYKEKFTVCFM